LFERIFFFKWFSKVTTSEKKLEANLVWW